MFNFKKLLAMLLVVVLALWLVGCKENDDDGEEGTEVIITVTKDSGVYSYKYFSLEQGIELPEAVSDTQEWDLRFKASFRILTNSGATAAVDECNSGGVGGVVFTGSTDFGVSVDTGTLNYGVVGATDIKPWIQGMGPAAETLTNLMNFPGYVNGTGIETDPYRDGGTWDQVQYCESSGMPPTYIMTDRVYVVRHGDGAGYSKVQLMSLEYSTVGTVTTYVFRFRYENID